MLLESVLVLLAYGAYKKSSQKGILTPEREKAYKSALEHLKDSDSLRKLADVYEKEGLEIEAAMLRRRADLHAQPRTTKKAHREAYDKGMRSSDVDAIEALATAFEGMTATGSAAALRRHAADVRRAQEEAAANEQAVERTPDEELGPSPSVSVVEPEEAPKEEAHVAEVVSNGTAVSSESPAHRPRKNGKVVHSSSE